MSSRVRIGVIGLGEAGSLIAAGLQAAGADVIGFDPVVPETPPVPLAPDVATVVTGADIVISINSSTAAKKVAEQVAPLLGADTVYADLNTGTPALKKALAGLFGDGVFADVAIMKPVPGLAEKVPMGVAGPGARRFVDLLEQYGMNLEYVSDVPGEAAARKLLRSILAKGMAAVLIAVGLRGDPARVRLELTRDSQALPHRHRPARQAPPDRDDGCHRDAERGRLPVDHGRRRRTHVLAHPAQQEDPLLTLIE